MKQDVSITSIANGIVGALSKVRPYAGLMFFVMLAVMYAFLILQINTLSSAPVDDAQVNTETSSAPSLHVDPQAAKQLQTLKDNSSNVKSLFEGNRTNPFQEPN